MAVFAGRRGELVGGRYQIQRVLGAGGMGEVAEARDVMSGRDVAIKVPHLHRTRSRRDRARFLREARVLRGLPSRHVPQIVDTGIWSRADGELPYIVFELLDGRDLATWLARRGPLPAEVAAEVVRQACCGVEAAHAAGLVHRDLKPANLFLALDDRERVSVKVLDFGIAGTVAPADVRITGDDLVGSPVYMAPEQMRPSSTIDRRTDVWSLGVVLYEAITGALPFRSSVFPDLCLKVMLDPPASPPDRAMPDALWSVIVRCLEKDPERRFSTAEELRVALEPWSTASLPFTATELELLALEGTLAPTVPLAHPSRRARSPWLGALALTFGMLWWRDASPRTLPSLAVPEIWFPDDARVGQDATAAVSRESSYPPTRAVRPSRPSRARVRPRDEATPLAELPVAARVAPARDPLESPF